MLGVSGLKYRGLTLEVCDKYLGQHQEPMEYEEVYKEIMGLNSISHLTVYALAETLLTGPGE